MILNKVLLSFQMRYISTNSPTERYGPILPQDFASKELLDALDALCI